MKEVYEKELSKLSLKERSKDQAGFTSSHHMAAEVTVRQMKRFLKISRLLRTRI